MITKIPIFIFWFSVFCIALTYFLYPLLLGILSFFIKRPVRKQDIEPSVSIIITAHNEENDIGRKMEESLELYYPKDKLQIIVASDASTDKTDDIVKKYKKQGVILVRQKERLGKTAAQNKAVDYATGEIIIFSDATTRFERDVIRKLVRNFADPKVGCVGAELNYVNGNNKRLGKIRNVYWSYEKFFRRKESNLNSLIGVSGCCYAVRKSIYKEVNPALISDFVITWLVFEDGYRSVFEPEAKVYESVLETENDEINMRARIASRSLMAFKIKKNLLNPLKFGFYSFQLIGHKLLRYFVPLFSIMVFISSLFLINIYFYRFFLYLQLFFLGLALIGLVAGKKSTLSAFSYLTIGNYSLLKGLLKSINGSSEYDMWKPLRHEG